MLEHYVKKILQTRVYDVARETPLQEAPVLSRRMSNRILLKREDLQPVFSFKIRGAYNRMAQMDREAQSRGVITSSAGNHAQGVALASQFLGVDAIIVMPETTPRIMVQAVRLRGATIELHGATYDEAYSHAIKRAAEEGRTFIHPYDDEDVIAGQGTVAMEILRQHSGLDIHAIFVPVGGGGLIAGIAAYVKYLYPQIKVIGVEPDDAASMHAALKAGERVRLEQVGIFVDGVAVRQVGELPFRIAKEYVDEVVVVSTDEVCAAIKDIFEDTRSIGEPAGALAVAGMKRYIQRESIREQTMVAIDSGANVNFDRLRHIAERAELGEQREALLAVTIPEEPGSFRRFCETLGHRAITEFNYRYAESTSAHVFVGIEMHAGVNEREELVNRLRTSGYEVIDLSDDETAKLHIRYMVGGHAGRLPDERLFRFEFPERPGALLKFLNQMGQEWNISLFHYRNHGADYGRVLCGMQVPISDDDRFTDFLQMTGYAWWEELGNPAYTLFLA